jgi:hypothetical protein
VADSESWSESASEGWTEGQAVGRGYSAGRTHGVGYSEGETVSLGAGRLTPVPTCSRRARLSPSRRSCRRWRSTLNKTVRPCSATKSAPKRVI